MTAASSSGVHPDPKPPALDAWYLTGPTASGKSRIALELARRLNAEIISLDSMSVYRGMDIGTAKPSLQDRQLIPHHLIDIVDPTDDYSLAEYVDAAHEQMSAIRSRGHEVLFVGGTPLYLKSLLRGLYQGPPPDWTFRQQVAEEVRQVGIEALHQRLEQVDPLSAAKLHPSDMRRIIRALEVYKVTGRPLSHQQTQFDEGTPAEACRVFVLDWPRPRLHERIEERVEGMFAAGLIDEAQRLEKDYGQLGRTASQAVGYREVYEYLQGTRDLASTKELVKARTRQFARRQETWFRSLCECRRVPLAEPLDPLEIAEQIASEGRVKSEE
ncbi:MAG: tRNA (adenosine(37)-N6)-dimethylallyltransferase MiaA [Gemmataceae bacterium]|nr:tRNA (adenosine(37)-N6)-dimethylallyltransferase MiaA [Gemmataceae bacterium]